MYESRVFTFVGEERRGKRACGARLKGGGTCRRRDVERYGRLIVWRLLYQGAFDEEKEKLARFPREAGKASLP